MHSVKIAELKCLYDMASKVRYTLVYDLVAHLSEVHTMVGSAECTRIAENLGCLEGAPLSYIEGEIPTLGIGHFHQAQILQEGSDGTISMLYAGYTNEVELLATHLALYVVRPLTLQLNER